MILDISITAKKEDTNAISYALQLIEKGKTKRLPKSLAVQPDLTSTYKTRKYPSIKKWYCQPFFCSISLNCM